MTKSNTIRLGMLTPSSNTALEPICSAIAASAPNVSVHFSRFRVTRIALDDEALGQFDERPMLAAAELLADAKVDAISWNGTSAGWLGLDTDRRLCERITAVTGIPASTAVLSLFDIMRERGEHRIGLVTPYTKDVQQAIERCFADEGIEVIAERHFDLSDNFSFGTVPEHRMSAAIEAVASASPDCVTVLCTNLKAAPLVSALENQFGVPIHDSVAAAMHGAIRATGSRTTSLLDYGRMFEYHAS